MKEDQMDELAEYIVGALESRDQPDQLTRISAKVKDLALRFPLPY
jgi:glycine/serine hydroxymethyltransferase